MTPLLLAGLFALLLVVLALVIRFYHWQIAEEAKNWLKVETDPVFRAERLRALDEQIASRPEDPRPRRERAAVRRLAGDRALEAEDLRAVLAGSPEDDTCWIELAEALLSLGRHAEAAEAAERATEIDPDCTDHYPPLLRALLLARETAKAEEALDLWEQIDAERQSSAAESPPEGEAPPTGDPALPLFRAAFLLLQGDEKEARAALRETVPPDREALLSDPALAPLVRLLPPV